ncbi:MAG: hypothetical protein A2144_02245 [Chloroflexi bacterium RBG_16_50_9]|nr:MAG: hypothetical protein A2144_02245 [Chloroflexi bacterium RBG_16_50_9]
MKKIAVEEHFFTEDYLTYLRSRKEFPKREIFEDENHRKVERDWFTPDNSFIVDPNHLNKIVNLGEGRLKDMDESGIDMQVLSLSFPGAELFDAPEGTLMAKRTNDELYKTIKKYPKRFAGLASIAPQNPETAATELERAVKELGFKGVMINSHVRGEYLDDRKYRVIFQKAEELDVPIYIHPKTPSPDMIKPYLAYPELALAMLGFAAEAGLHAMRLICSDVFDEYPDLKIILGHLGEALPYWLWRIDNHWQRSTLAKKHRKLPSQYFKDNFYITTSGMFWQPTLQFTSSVLGADRILFAVDYPYESSREGVKFMEAAPIPDGDKEKIFHLNAEKLLKL